MEFISTTYMFKEGDETMLALLLPDKQLLVITDEWIRLYPDKEHVKWAQPMSTMRRHPEPEVTSEPVEGEIEQTGEDDDPESPGQGQMPLDG